MNCDHLTRFHFRRFIELFDNLDRELTWLHAKYKIFHQLFAHSEERIMFLADKAPSFFRVTQDVLRDDIFLSLSRLTDPPQSMGKENLSIRTLQNYAKNLDDPLFYDDITSRVEEIVVLCKPFRDWRNRRLAHTDLPTILRYHPDPLPGINRKMIEDTLSRFRELFNAIIGRYQDSETRYEEVVLIGDGDTIVFLLERAGQFEQIERDKWRSIARGDNDDGA